MNSSLTWDEPKRQLALLERGLDFADAELVFTQIVFEFEDARQHYGACRMVCFGYLAGRLVVVGYVQRGEFRHIFSMRKANEREIAKFR
jgi:hypothetical protein